METIEIQLTLDNKKKEFATMQDGIWKSQNKGLLKSIGAVTDAIEFEISPSGGTPNYQKATQIVFLIGAEIINYNNTNPPPKESVVY